MSTPGASEAKVEVTKSASLAKVLWNSVALPLSFWRMEHAVDAPGRNGYPQSAIR